MNFDLVNEFYGGMQQEKRQRDSNRGNQNQCGKREWEPLPTNNFIPYINEYEDEIYN